MIYLQPGGTLEPVEVETVASLVISGSMRCRAYVHQKATAGEAIQVYCHPFCMLNVFNKSCELSSLFRIAKNSKSVILNADPP